MVVRVTCAGVPIGTAQFDPPQGVAHAALEPSAAYDAATVPARSLAQVLTATRYWSPRDGDLADAVAAQWTGGRLALEDESGRELGVNSVAVLEGIPGAPGESFIRVVADFRSDLARVEARRRPPGAGDGSRSRPAA